MKTYEEARDAHLSELRGDIPTWQSYVGFDNEMIKAMDWGKSYSEQQHAHSNDRYMGVIVEDKSGITDNERFEWLTNSGYYLGEFMGKWRLLCPHSGPVTRFRYKTPREAIDVVMAMDTKA